MLYFKIPFVTVYLKNYQIDVDYLTQPPYSKTFCHTRLHLGLSAGLKIFQVPTCKMEPQRGCIMQRTPSTQPLTKPHNLFLQCCAVSPPQMIHHQQSVCGVHPCMFFFSHPNCSPNYESMCGVPPLPVCFFCSVSPHVVLCFTTLGSLLNSKLSSSL